MSERVRAFMAILLPPELVAAAAAVQERLKPVFPPGMVRWVAPELFHLTVRFFGDLDPKGLEKARAVVEGLDGAFRPVEVAIDSVSAFPSPARPQTLWLGVSDRSGALDTLATETDSRIRAQGFGASDKPWKSHLTLGRVNRDWTGRAPQGWAAGLTWERGNFTIRTVALMQSELRPRGPVYTPLRTASASS